MDSYDDHILRHYRRVAEESGLSPSASMEDLRTRELETETILAFASRSLQLLSESGRSPEEVVVVDVGCGNGYTLETLRSSDNRPNYVGFEFSPELLALARQRFKEGGARILFGDIRQPHFQGNLRAHVLICQRVLINLLSADDQRLALLNLEAILERGGFALFIEAFASPLANLNEARAEFDLPPIAPADHNLYLNDDFFTSASRLEPVSPSVIPVSPRFLSTHYFVSRVFHSLVTRDRPFKRNSHWTRFFSSALAPNVGDYSPLRASVFRRVETDNAGSQLLADDARKAPPSAR